MSPGVRALWRRPLRSGLAAASIALAVAALLVAEAVAARARRAALAEIRRMGADVVVVEAQPSRAVAGRARTGTSVTTLREADAREIALRVPGAGAVAAEYRGTVTGRAGDLARRVTVSGDEASYAQLREAPVAAGRFFTPEDDAGAQRVAVLGARVAADVFGAATIALGRPLRLGGVNFTVIGILPERGTGVDAFDEDETVFVPLRTARRRLFNVDYVQRIFVRSTDGREVPQLQVVLGALLAARHPPPAPGEPLDFRVRDQRRLVTLRREAADRLRTYQVVLVVVLVVSGAGGIFAFQLLAVRERRAEIGTRRALGARRQDIFVQFVTEAGTVSALGSAGGVLLAWVVAALDRVTLSGLVTGAGATVFLAACVAAAAIPAGRAARLPPAVALR